MKKYLSFRNILIYCLMIFAFIFYIYNFLPHREEAEAQYTYAFKPSQLLPSESADEDLILSDAGQEESPLATANTEMGQTNSDLSLNVRGSSISLGESAEEIIKKLGAPGRINELSDDFEYYIYNNDYKRLLCIALFEGRAVGIYTDSLDFDYRGIKSGSSLSDLNKLLAGNHSLADIIEYEADGSKIQILMDSLDSQQVTGIYLLSDSAAQAAFREQATRCFELMVYDLTNSIRARNKLPVLSWSSSAALASRKHSLDMAANSFFSHENIKREQPEDRLRAEGIFIISSSENLAAGYDNPFICVHKLFNSKTHRKNILNKKFRYTGVGYAHVDGSKYSSYLTQVLYR